MTLHSINDTSTLSTLLQAFPTHHPAQLDTMSTRAQNIEAGPLAVHSLNTMERSTPPKTQTTPPPSPLRAPAATAIGHSHSISVDFTSACPPWPGLALVRLFVEALLVMGPSGYILNSVQPAIFSHLVSALVSAARYSGRRSAHNMN